jgi:uncharacterized repeat protein (TIGR03803 family)
MNPFDQVGGSRNRRLSLLRVRWLSFGCWLLLAQICQAATYANIQVLWSFPASNGTAFPYTALIEGSDGFLYGITYGSSSPSDLGAVFKIDKSGNNFSVLHAFTTDDGDTPVGPLIEATNGVLYGTTWQDGANAAGSMFSINKDGSDFTVIHAFDFATNDGAFSVSALLQASDGALYGTTLDGGAAPFGGYGVVFRIPLNDTNLTVIHSFFGDDGACPQSALIEGTNGVLYGTTSSGGLSNVGTIFMLDKSGNNFSVIHHFLGGTNDGSGAYADLLKGPGGKFYGTTYQGGLYNQGVLYVLNPDGGGFTVLHHFGGAADGSQPYTPLIQGRDGVLYGTTYAAPGTVFQINPDGGGYGIVINLGGTNGINPLGAMLAGSDGALYSTCVAAGAFNHGTVFKLTGAAALGVVLALPVNLGLSGWGIAGRGAPNQTYTLQFSPNLSSPTNWTTLGPVRSDSQGNWHTNDPARAGIRFYRTKYP